MLLANLSLFDHTSPLLFHHSLRRLSILPSPIRPSAHWMWQRHSAPASRPSPRPSLLPRAPAFAHPCLRPLPSAPPCGPSAFSPPQTPLQYPLLDRLPLHPPLSLPCQLLLPPPVHLPPPVPHPAVCASSRGHSCRPIQSLRPRSGIWSSSSWTGGPRGPRLTVGVGSDSSARVDALGKQSANNPSRTFDIVAP